MTAGFSSNRLIDTECFPSKAGVTSGEFLLCKTHYKRRILICLYPKLNPPIFVKNSQNLITHNPVKKPDARNSKGSGCQKGDRV